MHIFKYYRIQRLHLDFFRRQFSVLRYDFGHRNDEKQISNCCFHHVRKYCSASTIFNNQALAKYVEEFRKEFDQHEGGKFRGMRKEQASKKVQSINKLLNDIRTARENIKSLNELRSVNPEDEAFMKSLNKELAEHEDVIANAEDNIVSELLPHDERENCNAIILEITTGVGGQEAMLFAQELHDMYWNYGHFKNWNLEVTDLEKTELGGVRHSSISISGNDCYKLLRYEGGVHRVQRIPKTEKYGRMQTSTATIAIMSQPSEVEVVINDKDLRIETKTARGPGGQHVNKIETAVRIHHLPTGITVDCQVHRSQYQNRRIAMQKLRAKLYEIECEKVDSSTRNLRKFQVGSASRNEKVRTYNFNQDRITDHRFSKTVHNLQGYFEGTEQFDNFLQSLLNIHYDRARKQFLDEMKSMYS